jgi:hypothetical protein
MRNSLAVVSLLVGMIRAPALWAQEEPSRFELYDGIRMFEVFDLTVEPSRQLLMSPAIPKRGFVDRGVVFP